MIEYHVAKIVNFINEDFSCEIQKAVEKISKENNLNEENFKQIRHSRNQGYTVNGQNFTGDYVSFEIKKNQKVISHLDCFYSQEDDYIEIFSVPI